MDAADGFDGLVISGGAAKGPAFLGALQRLRERGDLAGVRAFSGTSIGALAAALAVAGADMRAVREQIIRQPFQLQFDLFSLDRPYGIDSGNRLLAFIRTLVGTDTFADCRRTHGRDLVVCATDLMACRPVYFSADSHPDMEVAWAIRLSCTLPLIFAYGQQGDDAYVDGGLTDNFPVAPLLDRRCRRILGLRFKQADLRGMPNDITEYVMTLLKCVAWRSAEQDAACARVCELVVPDVLALDFELPADDLRGLFRLGYQAVGT